MLATPSTYLLGLALAMASVGGLRAWVSAKRAQAFSQRLGYSLARHRQLHGHAMMVDRSRPLRLSASWRRAA